MIYWQNEVGLHIITTINFESFASLHWPIPNMASYQESSLWLSCCHHRSTPSTFQSWNWSWIYIAIPCTIFDLHIELPLLWHHLACPSIWSPLMFAMLFSLYNSIWMLYLVRYTSIGHFHFIISSKILKSKIFAYFIQWLHGSRVVLTAYLIQYHLPEVIIFH